MVARAAAWAVGTAEEAGARVGWMAAAAVAMAGWVVARMVAAAAAQVVVL